jgi:hypothetical protein
VVGKGESTSEALASEVLLSCHVPDALNPSASGEDLPPGVYQMWAPVRDLCREAVEEALLAMVVRDRLEHQYLQRLYDPWESILAGRRPAGPAA